MKLDMNYIWRPCYLFHDSRLQLSLDIFSLPPACGKIAPLAKFLPKCYSSYQWRVKQNGIKLLRALPPHFYEYVPWISKKNGQCSHSRRSLNGSCGISLRCFSSTNPNILPMLLEFTRLSCFRHWPPSCEQSNHKIIESTWFHLVCMLTFNFVLGIYHISLTKFSHSYSHQSKIVATPWKC